MFYLLLIGWSPSLLSTELETYFSLSSFSYSEPTAIKALGEDWDQPLYPGNVALSYNRIEFGVGWQTWRFGVIKRYDYFYQFSPATADFLYRIENNILLNTGDQYALSLSANTIISDGLRLSHQITINNFKFDVAMSYLESRSFVDGSLSGTAQAVSDKDYDLLFDIDYLYSEDKLFERKAAAPNGRGFGIDISTQWKASDQWRLKLDVFDLWSEMYWHKALRTVATADSNIKEFDEDGYVIFNPVASGVESTQSYTQSLPTKIFFNAAYMVNEKYSLLFDYDDYDLIQFYSMGLKYFIEDDAGIEFSYNYTAGAMKFRYQNKLIDFELVSDDLALDEAQTFALRFSLTFQY